MEFEMGIGHILADQEKWSYGTGFFEVPIGGVRPEFTKLAAI